MGLRRSGVVAEDRVILFRGRTGSHAALERGPDSVELLGLLFVGEGVIDADVPIQHLALVPDAERIRMRIRLRHLQPRPAVEGS